MSWVVAAVVPVLVMAAQLAPEDPRPGGERRPGGRYGSPQPVELAGMALAPEACHGTQVIVKGRLDLLEPGTYWQLVDGHARTLLLPALGMSASDFDQLIGAQIEVRGVCREIRPKEYMGGVDMDVVMFPDLPPLPAPRSDRPRTSVTVLSVTEVGPRVAGLDGTLVRTILEDPGRFAGMKVKIVGRFRGRNLFGDLPASTRRNPHDWVLRQGNTALWVGGKAPRGKGWSLDPDYEGDTVRWLTVEGRISVVGGVAYMRASSVALTQPPVANLDESR